MAQSSEYPDLKWMPPAAFGTGRDGKAVRYIVIHYTAGSERSTSAEDGAAYDQRRTDDTSTHYFVDSNSVVQCVRTKDRANAARHKGNRLGIQYELCGTVQSRAQWLDAASLPTLKLAAKQVARDCKKYDIPVRRLTVAQTRQAWTDYPNGPKGIVGHVDCTNAYPEDGGDHTDPGPQFPWDEFLGMVRAELEEDVALSAEDKKWIAADNDRAARAAAPLVWKVGWSGELAEVRLAKAASVAGAVADLDVQMDAYEAADAGRDAGLPLQVRDALAAGQPPEQVAAALRQVAGVDWVAVGRLLAS